MNNERGKVSRGTGGLRAYVGRLRTAEGCLNGIVFEGRTQLHVVSSQPDVRITSVDKTTNGRFVTELQSPSLKRALRDLVGAGKRRGIAKGAKALLARVDA